MNSLPLLESAPLSTNKQLNQQTRSILAKI